MNTRHTVSSCDGAEARAIAVRDVDTALLDHAARTPDAIALVDGECAVTYAELAVAIERTVDAFVALGVTAGERVAIVADKRIGTVAALFGAMRLGAVGVPINPLLKADQTAHVIADSGACILIAAPAVLEELTSRGLERSFPSLHHVIAPEELLRTGDATGRGSRIGPGARHGSTPESGVEDTSNAASDNEDANGSAISPRVNHDARPDDTLALILYTSGSTARPKGVMLSRSNLAHGAASVATYLGNVPSDRILAMMPLSFDYGLNQVLTALRVGARAVLFDYLVPKGVITAIVRHRITGLAAVPHIWNQLARIAWPSVEHLRYLTNTGGRMPIETTRALARRLPTTDIVLMYGFTEAFRSTRLPPEEVARRPDSIGQAVPHADVLVVDALGHECAVGQVGELIHGGPLVALGYWADEAATREKFRPRYGRDTDSAANGPGSVGGGSRGDDNGGNERQRPMSYAWSGDLARRDDMGYLYFVSRREDLAKLHGFRVNPLEIEEAIGRSSRVREVAVVCVPHPAFGHVAVAVVVANEGNLHEVDRHCREALPRFMRPERILAVAELPTGPNGKIDYPALRERYNGLFTGSGA